ncbi:TetR family transcriptional regulator [Roseibium aggregatum]|uniref:TetR family transcriptional regulator n=1 Tax=Roseibium aggregatum TaxID=187304 RepID=A0A926NZK4_9HYPH|nr:TetR family transcriptional regulator [Roseibium aggregatum]MBD1548339.1 TetR family transcriptional regulator [Roseibium aggregatum]
MQDADTVETDTQVDTQADTAKRILDAGEALFRHYGYSKTTVADIAKDLGMSTANIYRFFSSKIEIHQAICSRMLGATYQNALNIAALPLSAEERLRRYAHGNYQFTVDTMLDQEKVHEMVIVAIERDWHVIEKHIDRLNGIVEGIIIQGIEAGEFKPQDTASAARCFGASLVSLHHPQLVSQCMAKENRACADELIDFAIRALKG